MVKVHILMTFFLFEKICLELGVLELQKLVKDEESKFYESVVTKSDSLSSDDESVFRRNEYDEGLRSEWEALDPIFGSSGTSEKIKESIDHFHEKLEFEKYPRTMLFGADQGEFDKIWKIKDKYPEKYYWLHPELGFTHCWDYAVRIMREKHGSIWLQDLLLAMSFSKRATEAMLTKHPSWPSLHEFTICYLVLSHIFTLKFAESEGFEVDWISIFGGDLDLPDAVHGFLHGCSVNSEEFHSWLNNLDTSQDKTLELMKQFVMDDFPAIMGLYVASRTGDYFLNLTSL